MLLQGVFWCSVWQQCWCHQCHLLPQWSEGGSAHLLWRYRQQAVCGPQPPAWPQEWERSAFHNCCVVLLYSYIISNTHARFATYLVVFCGQRRDFGAWVDAVFHKSMHVRPLLPWLQCYAEQPVPGPALTSIPCNMSDVGCGLGCENMQTYWIQCFQVALASQGIVRPRVLL